MLLLPLKGQEQKDSMLLKESLRQQKQIMFLQNIHPLHQQHLKQKMVSVFMRLMIYHLQPHHQWLKD